MSDQAILFLTTVYSLLTLFGIYIIADHIMYVRYCKKNNIKPKENDE